MKLLFTFFLSLAVATTVFAQAPAIQWQKSLGGTSIEYGYSVQPTTDGGYIVAGHAASANGDVTGNHGADDYWVVKLSSAGTIQWQKSLGGIGPDYGYSIRQTTDGGYVVFGTSFSNDGDVTTGNHGIGDFWVAKLTSTGTLQWQKAFGGSGADLGTAIRQTSDGGYIITGQTQSNDGDVSGNHGDTDCWVVKLTSTGTMQWQKTLGGSSADYASSVQQTTDGGYILAGTSRSTDGDVSGNHGDADYWIVKLSSTGTIQWQKALGGSGPDYASSIQQTTDGGYIVAGGSNSNGGDVTGNHGNDDYWIVKLSSTGTMQWQKSLGGTGYDAGNSIQQTADGGFIISGQSTSTNGDVAGNHGGDDYWIVKLNSTGMMQWQKSLGGTGTDYGGEIRQTSDGGFCVVGTSTSTDGDVTGNHGNADFWMIKLGPDPAAVSNTYMSEAISVYPNPATTELRVQCSEAFKSIAVTDLAGRTFYQTDSSTPVTELTVPTATLPNGLYLIRLQTSTGTRIMKFQVQH